MDNTTEKVKRSVDIYLLCMFGVLNMLANILVGLSLMWHSDKLWLVFFVVPAIFGGAACIAGLWKMKKWTVFVFPVVIFLGLVIWCVLMEKWNVINMAPLLIAIFLLQKEYKDMT